MKAGETQTPQFATAEYSPNTPDLKCAACRQPIGGTYFQIRSAPVCAACTEKLRSQIPKDSHAAFVRALLFGIGGAVVGLALYVTVALATGLVIGFVSLAVGYIIGKAMHMGSGGVGGRRYQVVAVLLTYFAVSMSAVPIAIEQSRLHHRDQTQETTAQPEAPVNLARTLSWLGLDSPHRFSTSRIPSMGSLAWSFYSSASGSPGSSLPAEPSRCRGPIPRRRQKPREMDRVWLS
jgi:uncharacterized protein (DUF983 family)